MELLLVKDVYLSINEKILRFINLKKLILTKCYFTERLIENLWSLVQYQLNELILTIDKDTFERKIRSGVIRCGQESNFIFMVKEFIRNLFSVKCQLTSLNLDISNDRSTVNIHECFLSSSNISSNLINHDFVTHCTSLRYLHIHLIHGFFLEHIIERLPSLEILSVQFQSTLVKEDCIYEPMIKKFSSSINWYDKIPKLKCFTLKSKIFGDNQLVYLKWIMNQVNYIEKLKISLDIKEITNQNCVIDGNFLHKYCMPDILTSLINFDFYIVSKCKILLSNDIDQIIDSFKSHYYFADGQWTNVKCFFDPIMSRQHISSTTIIRPRYFDGIIDYPTIFDWQYVKYIQIDLCPSIYLFLKQFDILFPHIDCIKFDM
ncbi:unnamed protein product, partial [Rotaria sp. Silwood2]